MSAIKKIPAEIPDEYTYKSATVRVTLGDKNGKNEKKSRNKLQHIKKTFDQANNENKT